MSPIAGFKIATGYVEVEINYDQNRLRKAAEEAGTQTGRRFADSFGKEFQKRLQKKMPWKQVEKDLKKGSKETGDKTGQNFTKAFRERVNKDLSKDLSWKGFDKGATQQAGNSGRRAGNAFARNFSSNAGKASTGRVGLTGDQEKGWGNSGRRAGAAYSKGFQKSVADSSGPLSRAFNKQGRDMGNGFATNFRRTFVAGSNGISEAFGRSSGDFSSLGKKSGRNFSTGIRDYLATNGAKDIRPVIDRFGNDTSNRFRMFGRTGGRGFLSSFRNALGSGSGAGSSFRSGFLKSLRLGDAGKQGGRQFGEGFRREAHKNSMGFWRSFREGMRTQLNLTVGGLVAILAGVAVLLPPVGAALAGALTLGFAGGLGALGVLAQAQTKEVRSAFSSMKDHIVSDFRKVSAPMKNVLVQLASDIRSTYDALSPSLRNFFKTTEPSFKRFQRGILDGFKAWGPAIEGSGTAFDALSKHMGPMFRAKIAELGDAFKELFKVVERNPEAVTAVFSFLMDVIINLVKFIGWLTEKWAQFYNAWQSDSASIRSIATGLWSFVKGALGALVSFVGTLMKTLAEMISGVVMGFKSIFTGLFDIIVGVFTGDWSRAWEGLKTLGSGIYRVVEGIVRGVVTLFTGMFKTAVQLVAAIFAAFGVDTSKWVSNTMGFFSNLWSGIAGWFSRLGPAISGWWSNAWSGVRNFWNTMVGWFRSIGAGFINVVTWPFKEIYRIIVGNSIVPDLVRAVLGWFRNMGTWIRTVFNGIRNFFVTVWNGIRAVTLAIVGGMVSGIRSLFNGLRNFFVTVWSGIRAVWNTLVRTVVSVARSVFSSFVRYVRSLFSGLRNFFVTVWNGIRAVWNTLVRTVVSVARSVFSSFVSFVRSLFNGLRNFFTTIWNSIRNVWNTLVRTVVSVARTVFRSFVSYVRSLFSGLRNFFTTVWNSIRSVWNTVIRSITALGRSLFSSFVSAVRKLFSGLRSFFTSVWNAIRNTTLSIVRALVRTIQSLFSGLVSSIRKIFGGVRNFFRTLWNGVRSVTISIIRNFTNWVRNAFTSFVKWIQNKFSSMRKNVVSIWNAMKNGVWNVVRNFTKWVRDTFNKFVGWIYNKWNALRRNSVNIWNSMRSAISNVVSRFTRWVRNAFTRFVGWIYDKWNALRRNSANIWNSMRNAIERVVSRFTRWVRNAFTRFVGWIYDKWNALRRNSTNIWNQMRNAIERVMSRFMKWIRGVFTRFVGWIYDKWNALRRNSVNIWNQMKNGIIGKIKDFRNGAMKVVNAFKDGVIKAFDNTKKGVGRAWDGVKRLAAEPVKFMVNTVYEKGIRILWSKIADHVKGLGYLKKITLPKGFATGGIMPGYTPGRDVHTVPSHMGPVGLSGGEAIMRPEWTRAVGPDFVNSMNAAARRGGVEGVKKALTPKFGTSKQYEQKVRKDTATREPSPMKYATGGVVGQQPGGNFDKGGIFGTVTSALKKKWEDIEGGIVNWAKKPFNALKNSMADKGGKKQNFPGVPYHMTTNIIDKMLAIFAEQDEEFSGGGSAEDVVKLARKSVGKYPESGGNNTNAITKWFGMNGAPWCAMFISWLFDKSGASPALKKAKRTAWTGDYYTSGMKKVAEKNSMPGDVAVYGTQHVNLVETKNSRIGGNESNNVRRSNRKGGAIFRPDWSKAGGAGGGSKNTVFTSFWDPTTASGKRMNAGTISSSVMPLGTKLRVTIGKKSANGTVEDFGPAGFVYKRHHPKAVLDLNEIMMQKLTGRRSNTTTGSFKVTKRGSGRTLFGYTNWKGNLKGGSTGAFADGGIMPMGGSTPMGLGTHDVGGLLPDRHVSYNRSGTAEVTQTLDQIKAMANLIEKKGDTIYIDKVCIDGADINKMQDLLDMFNKLKQTSRANKGNVGYRLRG